MKSRRRLVQNVQGLARARFWKLARQLDSLSLSAGKLSRRLAQFDIAEAHTLQCLQLPA